MIARELSLPSRNARYPMSRFCSRISVISTGAKGAGQNPPAISSGRSNWIPAILTKTFPLTMNCYAAMQRWPPFWTALSRSRRRT